MRLFRGVIFAAIAVLIACAQNCLGDELEGGDALVAAARIVATANLCEAIADYKVIGRYLGAMAAPKKEFDPNEVAAAMAAVGAESLSLEIDEGIIDATTDQKKPFCENALAKYGQHGSILPRGYRSVKP